MQDKNWFLSCLKNKDLIEKLTKITLIISDIDGCLTDGKAYYSESNNIQKNFSIQDGFLMAKCNQPAKPHLALISGRSDAAATKRAKALAIPDHLYYQGINHNKSRIITEIQEKLSIKKQHTLFFGDDVLDIETKENVALFACPLNALFYVQDNSDIITPRKGGDGALRMVLDLIFYIQKKHPIQKILEKSLAL